MQKSILVMEENVMVHGLIESALSQGLAGIQIVHEQQKEQFLIKAREINPDLILLSNADQQNDYATVKALKEDEQVGNVPVMLLTSARDELDEEYLESLGVIGFLRKPFESVALQQQMKAVFQDLSVSDDDDGAFNLDSSETENELDQVNLVDDDLLGMMGAQDEADQMSMDDLAAELEPTRVLEEEMGAISQTDELEDIEVEQAEGVGEEKSMEDYLEAPLEDEEFINAQENEEEEVVGAMGFSAEGEISIGDLEEESDIDFMDSTEMPFSEDEFEEGESDVLVADQVEPLDMDLEEMPPLLNDEELEDGEEDLTSFEEHSLPDDISMDVPEFGDDMGENSDSDQEESQIPASIQKMVSLKQVIKAHHVLSEKLDEGGDGLEGESMLEEIPLEDEELMDYESAEAMESFVEAPDFDSVVGSEEFILDEEEDDFDHEDALAIPGIEEDDDLLDESQEAAVFGLDDLNVEDLSVEDPGLGMMLEEEDTKEEYVYLEDDTEALESSEEVSGMEEYSVEFYDSDEDAINFEGLGESEFSEDEGFNAEEIKEIYVEDLPDETDSARVEDFAVQGEIEVEVESCEEESDIGMYSGNEDLPEIELNTEDLDFSDVEDEFEGDIESDFEEEFNEDDIDLASLGALADDAVLPSMDDHMDPIDFSSSEDAIEIDEVAVIEETPLVEEIYHEEEEGFNMEGSKDEEVFETSVDDLPFNNPIEDDTSDMLEEGAFNLEDSIDGESSDMLEEGAFNLEESINQETVIMDVEPIENEEITFDDEPVSFDEENEEVADDLVEFVTDESEIEQMKFDESGFDEEPEEEVLDIGSDEFDIELEEEIAIESEIYNEPDLDDDIAAEVDSQFDAGEPAEVESDIGLSEYGIDELGDDVGNESSEQVADIGVTEGISMVTEASSFEDLSNQNPVMGLAPAEEQISGMDQLVHDKVVGKLSEDVKTRLGAAIEEVISDTIQTTLHEMLPELMEKILREELDDK